MSLGTFRRRNWGQWRSLVAASALCLGCGGKIGAGEERATPAENDPTPGGAANMASTTQAVTSAGGATTTTVQRTSSTKGGGGGTTSATENTAQGGGDPGIQIDDPIPYCPVNNGTSVVAGGTCDPSQFAQCIRSCGVQSVGRQIFTCLDGIAVADFPNCTYVGGDFGCYAIPEPLSSECPTTGIQVGATCTVSSCTPCNANGAYLDAMGAAKRGYCTCFEKSDGSRAWSCATVANWPCPGSLGC